MVQNDPSACQPGPFSIGVLAHLLEYTAKGIVFRTECTNHLYYTAVPCTCSYRRTGSARTRTEVARRIYALNGEQTANAAQTGDVCSWHRAKARIIICPAKRQPKDVQALTRILQHACNRRREGRGAGESMYMWQMEDGCDLS
jgi:hypothetical protein